MSDSTTTAGLVSTWVSTVDARGHAHLEARWVEPTPTAPARLSSATAAPPAPLGSHGSHAA